MAYPTGELSVDLRAIADNWRCIKTRLGVQTECGAVVKANAYGLGVDRIAPKIYEAGCRHFFVANLKEAMQLQSLVGRDALVFVLSGCNAGAEETFVARGIIPVIVSHAMLLRWAQRVGAESSACACLKVNTGMGRLGLEISELESLLEADVGLFHAANIKYLMSHLACADTPEHPLNQTQLQRFLSVQKKLAAADIHVKATLANSAGVFTGEQAHCDIVRPGIALFGGNPGVEENPMKSVVGLALPVIQVRCLPVGESVGYGATRVFDSERFIAVASGGYADGIMRSLSNRGWGYLNGHKVPIVGRISMDSTMFDVTEAVAAKALMEGEVIEILGEHVSLDDFAEAAGTISYEVLTSLGARYQRCYID